LQLQRERVDQRDVVQLELRRWRDGNGCDDITQIRT